MEHCPTIKKNELLIHTTTWMNPKTTPKGNKGLLVVVEIFLAAFCKMTPLGETG